MISDTSSRSVLFMICRLIFRLVASSERPVEFRLILLSVTITTAMDLKMTVPIKVQMAHFCHRLQIGREISREILDAAKASSSWISGLQRIFYSEIATK